MRLTNSRREEYRVVLTQLDFFSYALNMCVQADVLLPERRPWLDGKTRSPLSEEDKYPTLYLLHGMSDDHTCWRRRTLIECYAEEYNLAVVMPSVNLGWYTDMAYGARYYTYVSKELPEVCRSFFPFMSDKREKTFAAGLSMGGYGAFKLGLKASETFGAAASLSGGVGMPTMFLGLGEESRMPIWTDVFGPPETHAGSENDLFAAAKELVSSGKPFPELYMWCGTEDFLYYQNTKMRDHLQNLHIPVTYKEAPGDHQWKYWDEYIKDVLAWLPLERRNG